MPINSFGRTPETWSGTHYDNDEESVQAFCPHLCAEIEKIFQVQPKLSSYKNDGRIFFVFKIPVEALGNTNIDVSYAPTDRFPKLRKLRHASDLDRMVMSTEFYTHPYVVLEYQPGYIPKLSWKDTLLQTISRILWS